VHIVLIYSKVFKEIFHKIKEDSDKDTSN